MVYLIDPAKISMGGGGPKCPHNCSAVCGLCSTMCKNFYQPEYGVIVIP